MPVIDGEWHDWSKRKTRQFVFEHHTPIMGLAFVVIPDAAMHRIAKKFVRGVNNRGCWEYGNQFEAPRIAFKTDTGLSTSIRGNRLALLLMDDCPIPDGKLACHICHNGWCVNPSHIYCGTNSENNLDTYHDGRRSVPASRRNADHERLRLERTARQNRVPKCTRFLPDLEVSPSAAPLLRLRTLVQAGYPREAAKGRHLRGAGG